MAQFDDDPAFRFMRLMWAVDHGLHKVSKRMTSVLGITGQQRFAVRVIANSPDITPGELSERMHLDPSTVTGILRRLEQSRMVVRRNDPGDARRTRLTLTEAGRRIDRLNAGTIESAVRSALGACPQGDVRAASRVLAALADELSAPSALRPRRR